MPDSSSPGPVRFLVLYDQADEPHSALLNRFLSVLKITKKVDVWNAHSSPAPTDDKLAMAKFYLGQCDYVVALVTANLFASPDWYGLLFEALRDGRKVVPVRVENTDLLGTGLENLVGLPSQNRVVGDFTSPDAAWNDVVAGLRRLLPR